MKIIKKQFWLIAFRIVIIALIAVNSSQLYPKNPYNLKLIETKEAYIKSTEQNSDNALIELNKLIPSITLDIRYATENNFTKEIIYTAPKAFARKPVAEALNKVQDSLAKLNLGLLIYDAYRPYSASLKFFEVYPDTNFVANPKFGSRHNRGCAVDLTIISLKTGKSLEMTSEYDDFSEKAHPEYDKSTEQAKKNRTLLFDIMKHFGFMHFPTEWWHFDFVGWNKFDLMDIPFEILEEINR